jgi:hypothetical protein
MSAPKAGFPVNVISLGGKLAKSRREKAGETKITLNETFAV